MPRWKRTSDETRAKVIELKLWNLDLSSHDIEDMLKGTEWQVSSETVCDIINTMAQIGTTDRWQKQIKRLEDIVSTIEEITHKAIARMVDKEDLSINDIRSLNDISKTNFERKRLIAGDSTENTDITIKWQA